MSITVTIGGVNYDALENKVSITDNAERRSDAIIHIFDDKSSGSFFSFEPYQSVSITDTNGHVAFSGVIIKPVAQLPIGVPKSANRTASIVPPASH